MPRKINSNNGYVLVVDVHGKPLMPCLSSRAKKMRESKRARIYCMQPFTIQILDRTVNDSVLQDTELKLDPGSKTSGMALCIKGALRGWFMAMAIHIEHRSHQIRDALISRRQIRHGRRNRKTRYRAPRFNNRARKPRTAQGYSVWLAPSVVSRIENIVHLAFKFSKYFPILQIGGELNKFDTQKMMNAEISGVEYQRGTLYGFEVREYLLQKHQYTCVYCQKSAVGAKAVKDIRLELDHVVPKSKGGSDRVNNLVLACHCCNQNKGNQSLQEFLKRKPAILKRVQESLDKTLNLQDAAQMNTMRKELYQVLKNRIGLPVQTYTASQTKYNRGIQSYTKDHWVDAACVGDSGNQVNIAHIARVNIWKAVGRGNRQMCLMNKFGFPRTRAKTVKRFMSPEGKSFQSGDVVQLKQPSGKYQGKYIGTVSVRADGRFDVTITTQKRITSLWKNIQVISRFNGYHIIQKDATAYV